MSYLLALDAGTGSVRAVVFDLHGNQISVGQAEWKHAGLGPGGLRARDDAVRRPPQKNLSPSQSRLPQRAQQPTMGW